LRPDVVRIVQVNETEEIEEELTVVVEEVRVMCTGEGNTVRVVVEVLAGEDVLPE